MVGEELLARSGKLRAALEAAREGGGHAFAALMVTDIVAKGTRCWSRATWRRSSARSARAGDDGAIALPGVMSRKKQVAPKIFSAA